MTATSITPPIVLARKARHRKPNRRRGSIAVVTFKRALLVFLVAFFLGAIFPQLDVAAHAATVTPSSEAHACHLAVVLHEHRLQGAPIPAAAIRAVKNAARNADRELGGDILRYVRTDRGWVAVVDACNPDAPVGQP